MNKPIYFALALGSAAGLLGAGCFGGNPNQNSQLANTDGSSSAGGSSGNLPDASTSIVGNPLATFDTNTSGFVLNTYHDTGTQIDLGDPTSGAATPPTMTFDGTEGSPSPGSLKVVAPFFGANQYVDIQNTSQFGMSNLQNWSGGTLHVRIKITSGTFTGGVQLYVDTGTTYSFGGTYTNVGKGSDWQEFVMSVDSPMSFGNAATYSAKSVIAYGLQLNTGSAGANASTVTFNIDSFSIAGVAPATGTGGTSGGAGGTAGAGGSSGAAGAGGSSGAAGAGGSSGAAGAAG